MWNTPPNTPKAEDLANEHWRILTQALTSLDADPRTVDVYKALDYFRARVIRQGGINLIAAGLRDCNAEHIDEGLRLLRHHLGSVISVD